ncbi:MAG: CD225/dispanin family protein [Siphonobacter sp.]
MSTLPPFPPDPEAGSSSVPKPQNWLIHTIVVTVLSLFCCLCFINLGTGIAGIIFATQVDAKYNAGDYAGAEKAANNAKILFYVTAGLVAVAFIINIVYLFIAGGSVYQEILRNRGYNF